MKIVNNPLDLNFSIKVSATDFPKREISGRIVTWNEPGTTSAGSTVFLQDSITFGATTKLLLEHRRDNPIGFLKSYTNTPEGIDAVFSVATTNAGNDALVEASTQLRDGFSVGVLADKYKNVDGVLTISASSLKEVSLVTDPAIASAKVSIAASENENSESESGATDTDSTNPTTEGDNEVENTPTVPEAPAEAVEAVPQSMSTAPRPVMFTSPRSPIISASSYLEHTLQAALGNEDSRQYVRAADDSFTSNPAFDQVSYLNRVIDPSTKFGRPTIDAFGGAIGTRFIGQTVSVPKVTTNSTVTVEAEEGATSETGVISAFVTADVKKYAGMQTFSQELLDLSGSPVFYDMMLTNLYAAYAKATNEAVIAECVSGGTAGTNQAATAAGLIAFHATESAAAYLATGDFASAYIAGSSQWVLAMGATDTTGRPMFNAGQGVNTAGVIGATSARGKFLDLDFYADRGMVSTTIDDSAFIVVPSAMLLLEQAPQKLQVAVLGSGQYEVSLHGYLATKTLIAGGIRKFNIA